MIKLLIGGSPCTFWSIAQKNNRETEPKGFGWELFENYLIAKEKFKPDFFLYENNKSASKAIKDEIKNRLNVWDGSFFTEDTGVRYIEINSALVSAQNRQRFYVHNCGDVEQPEDRGIFLIDIIERGEPITENKKSFCITATEYKGSNPAQTICKRRRTLIAEPFFDSRNTLENTDYIFSKKGKKTNIIYEVKKGEISIKQKKYPINIKDGYYIIRKLTVKECCRLQTLPDDYCRAVSNTQAYKGIGNGWTAEVIIHILGSALKDVPRDEKIVVLSMYDGIGTGRYCLDKMGFTNVEYYASEIDKYAMQIAKSNYPDIRYIGDAYNVRNKDWSLEKYAK